MPRSYSRDFGGENWLDQRRKAQAYTDRDPTVLIVGGGQAGLSVAARLKAARRRHADRRSQPAHRRQLAAALPLADPAQRGARQPPAADAVPADLAGVHPKDKLANWFETYVESLELNFWTGTELAGGRWDDKEGCWTVTLQRSDGSERTMKPRHIVFATGVSGIPIWPDVPGLDDFKGAVMHSGQYTNGADWKGRKALVIGTGNSGHDVAQDLCASGVDVTIVQRSPTYIV